MAAVTGCTPPTTAMGTVSLRDAVRCASLSRRFAAEWREEGEMESGSFFDVLNSCRNSDERNGDEHPLWAVGDQHLRPVALACYLCFGMRTVPRATYLSAVERECGVDVGGLVGQVRERLVLDGLSLSLVRPDVVQTDALKDNLLAAVVAVSSRLPLLCLGSDGTSKTLSLNILKSQLGGGYSKTPLLRCLPRVQTFNLQLSEHSTARHILDLKVVLDAILYTKHILVG